MGKLLGKHIFLDKSGTNTLGVSWSRKYLRRINRETPTQYISDVQRVVKDYDKKPYKRVLWGKCAIRFKKRDDIILPPNSSWNKKEGNTINIYLLEEDSTPLLSTSPWEEMFERDIREYMEGDNCTLRSANESWQHLLDEGVGDEIRERMIFTFGLNENPIAGASIKPYLEEMFNRPAYKVSNFYAHLDFDTDHASILEKNMIFHQITINGEKKKHATREETAGNFTIGFWLFEDRVIFHKIDGCGSW